MKARFFTTTLLSLLTVCLMASPIDGYWRCAVTNDNIEILYTTDGIKVRNVSWSDDRWDIYNKYGENRYRDLRGNSYFFSNNQVEFSSHDRRRNHVYDRYERSNNDRRGSDWDRDRGYDNDRNWNRNGNNDRGLNRNEREDWNRYYKGYEGKWHNHTTGERIHVDLSRRSLRIKFKGESWFEVYERSRGLFVDRRGNEFIFRGDFIDFRATNNDLNMKFHCDARCDHNDDFRSEYWR